MIIVTTYGSDEWNAKGAATAEEHHAWHYHYPGTDLSLGVVRNQAVAQFGPQAWITFLDAGDHLCPGYFDFMGPHLGLIRDLLVPRLQIGDGPAMNLSGRDIINGSSPCCIGTTIHRFSFDRVGGFWAEPAWEDWSLFRRCVLTGSKLIFTDSIYHAEESTGGRNSTIRNPKRLYSDIVNSHTEWMTTR